MYNNIVLYTANHIIARLPSHSARLFFYRHAVKINIGLGSSVLLGASFDALGNLSIGNNSVINQNCRLDNRGGILIGNNVSVSAETCILTGDHDVQDKAFAARHRAVKIDDYVFIGTRATILPGIKLGTGCIVGVGAVVTKDVDPFSIVAGVPAKRIGTRNVDLDYTLHWAPFLG